MNTLTQVAICNMALSRIGAQPITDIADPLAPSAVACNTWWDQTRDEVGRAVPWSCLMKRIRVDAVAGYPPPGATNDLYEWNAEYLLPGDYLKMVELNGNDVWACDGRNGDLWEIYGQALLNPSASTGASSTVNQYGLALFADVDPDPITNQAPMANMKYVARVTDVRVWDALFVGAFVVLLAARVATIIRKDDLQVAQGLEAEYKRDKLPAAAVANGNEGKPRRYDLASESRFISSRWRSTNG
jgi:hypothetical protein